MSAAFEKLKTALITEPAMPNHPHWDKSFEIHVDASNYGLGAETLLRRTSLTTSAETRWVKKKARGKAPKNR